MKYTLGIDIGTGSVKAVAVDDQCRSFEVSQQFYNYRSPKPGYHEQDPAEIWQAFKVVINSITSRIGSSPMTVGLSSAMHSVIPVNEDCVALGPMITWADNRSSEIAEGLRMTAEGMAIYETSGTPLHAMSPLCKIIWIRENDPVLFSRTSKFISIKEYIWYSIFHEYELDQSGASCTGLFDILNKTWNAAALNLAGLSQKRLSKVVPNDYYRKYFNSKISPDFDLINPGTPFVIGASDGCLANLGSMADKPGIAAITIGTSGAVRVASDRPLPNADAMTFSYILDKDTYICGGPINNGGIALQWWLKTTKNQLEENDYEEFFKRADTVKPGSKGLLFLPYLTGERAPVWDSESCGTFFGVRLHHNHSDFSRAVLEGICFALKDVLDAVQQKAEPIKQINISGGVVRSDLWMQMLSDITDKKLVMVQSDDASAVGAALLAMKSTGMITAYPEAPAESVRIFEPDKKNAETYAQLFGIYKQLYRNLKTTMRDLSKIAPTL